MWRSRAESIVALHPEGFEESRAYATDGKQQVGSASDIGNLNAALLVWFRE